MKFLSFCILLILIFKSSNTKAYRILGVVPVTGTSHFLLFQRLAEELASRGHQVDVISHYPRKKPLPNYNDIIDLTGSVPDMKNNMTYDFATNTLGKKSLINTLATTFGNDICEMMNLPKFQDFIHNPPKDPPYDLAIIETFAATCFLALGQHLNVPVVGVVTSSLWPWINGVIANPDNPSYIPHVFSGLSGNMNFWQRLENAFTLWKMKWEYNYYSAPQDDMIKKYIGPHAPSLEEAMRNVSLFLTNSHYTLHGVRPFTTGVVEIGGLHISKNPEPLPEDLKKWLDDSTNGCVLISFGSMVKIESFPTEEITALYRSLNKLAPIRVLMKIAKREELLPGLPSNVLTHPWIPQDSVLQHKNIRAFMTHGGLLGTQEAVYRGVPMIGVPFFSDQTQNVDLYEQKKIAVRLNHDQLTEENLDKAFDTILNDPSYMASAKKLSAEFRDRPMSPMETAVFWVEYVIRHGGTPLRSPAMDLTWWQITLLDVYAVIIIAILLGLYLFKVLFDTAKNAVLGNGFKNNHAKDKKNK